MGGDARRLREDESETCAWCRGRSTRHAPAQPARSLCSCCAYDFIAMNVGWPAASRHDVDCALAFDTLIFFTGKLIVVAHLYAIFFNEREAEAVT